MICSKAQAQGTEQLMAPAITIRADIHNQVRDQIHLTPELKGSVMESEIPPCLPHNQTCPAATSSKQPWAILDLGQHYTLWDSISPFLCAGFLLLLLYSPLLNHLISHTPHGSASLDYVATLCRPTENRNVTMK